MVTKKCLQWANYWNSYSLREHYNTVTWKLKVPAMHEQVKFTTPRKGASTHVGVVQKRGSLKTTKHETTTKYKSTRQYNVKQSDNK